MRRINVWFVCLIPALLGAQDMDHYINLAFEGKREPVEQALPNLRVRYPDSGALLFLEALLIRDAETAIEQYRKIYEVYPSDPWADDAILKVGEYLYARGLYVQAAKVLGRIPMHFPRSDLIYQSTRLFLNSLLVSGERDTALFYAQVFAHKYPQFTFDLQTGKAQLAPSDIRKSMAKVPENAVASEVTAAPIPVTEFGLQAGAFSVRGNAERQRDLLISLNYLGTIAERNVGGRILYIVILEGFASKSAAGAAGKLLLKNYGIDYQIIPIR